jgi:hypothetical protein
LFFRADTAAPESGGTGENRGSLADNGNAPHTSAEGESV